MRRLFTQMLMLVAAAVNFCDAPAFGMSEDEREDIFPFGFNQQIAQKREFFFNQCSIDEVPAQFRMYRVKGVNVIPLGEAEASWFSIRGNSYVTDRGAARFNEGKWNPYFSRMSNEEITSQFMYSLEFRLVSTKKFMQLLKTDAVGDDCSGVEPMAPIEMRDIYADPMRLIYRELMDSNHDFLVARCALPGDVQRKRMAIVPVGKLEGAVVTIESNSAITQRHNFQFKNGAWKVSEGDKATQKYALDFLYTQPFRVMTAGQLERMYRVPVDRMCDGG